MTASAESKNEFIERRSPPSRCVEHEERIKSVEVRVVAIDRRQDKIFKSMYGENGNIKEGYVYKLERLLEWFAGFERLLWIIIPVCVMGALAAIWQVTRMAVLNGKI